MVEEGWLVAIGKLRCVHSVFVAGFLLLGFEHELILNWVKELKQKYNKYRITLSTLENFKGLYSSLERCIIFMLLFHMLCIFSEATEFPQGARITGWLVFSAQHQAMNEFVTWHALVHSKIEYSNYIERKQGTTSK